MLVNMPVAEYWGRGSVRVSGVLVQPDMVEEGKYHVEEEEEEGQADFGPIDNLPMAGGSRSEVCFCLVKIDI